MKVSVWDTYVERDNGKSMHFDILVPQEMKDHAKVFEFGKSYLAKKPFTTGKLTASECKFCHIERATEEIIDNINKTGFHIIEMENCD